MPKPRTSMKKGEKVWTAAHQLRLEELFENKTLKKKSTPKTGKAEDDMFKDIATNTFTYHFNKTKELKASDDDDEDSEELEDIRGIFSRPSTSAAAPDQKKDSNSNFIKGIIFENPPVTKWTLYDHVGKFTRLFVAMDCFSGATNYEFKFNDEGTVIYLESTWSPLLIDPDDLFAEELKAENPTMAHLKVHAYKTELLGKGITENSNIKQKITIPLGMKVLKDESAYDVKVIKRNNRRAVILSFRGFQESVIVESAKKRKFNVD